MSREYRRMLTLLLTLDLLWIVLRLSLTSLFIEGLCIGGIACVAFELGKLAVIVVLNAMRSSHSVRPNMADDRELATQRIQTAFERYCGLRNLPPRLADMAFKAFIAGFDACIDEINLYTRPSGVNPRHGNGTTYKEKRK